MSKTASRCRFQCPVHSTFINFFRISIISWYCNQRRVMLFFLMLSLLLICCNTSAEHTSSTNSEDDIFFIYSSLASVKSVMTLSMFLFRLFHHHMSEPQLHLLLVLEHCIHQPEELNSRQHLLINGHGLLSI